MRAENRERERLSRKQRENKTRAHSSGCLPRRHPTSSFERARYSTVCIVKEEEKSGGGRFSFFFSTSESFRSASSSWEGEGEGLLSRSRSLRIHLIVFRALYIPVTVGNIYIYIYISKLHTQSRSAFNVIVHSNAESAERKKSSNP